jgi:hypothetical protein
MKQYLFAITIMVASISHAIAGPASEAARMHFSAIGDGDIPTVMLGYDHKAQLNWIGGSLAGAYNGIENIRAAWEKFSQSAGPLQVNVGKLEESLTPKGETVLANVQFDGKTSIKVRYALTYRQGKLISETWQVDPKLVSTGY